MKTIGSGFDLESESTAKRIDELPILSYEISRIHSRSLISVHLPPIEISIANYAPEKKGREPSEIRAISKATAAAGIAKLIKSPPLCRLQAS